MNQTANLGQRPYPVSFHYLKRNLLFLCSIFYFCTDSISQQSVPTDATRETYAIVVGISAYRYIKPLNYADRDADLFTDLLRSDAGGNIKEENLFLLKNDSANAGNFWSALLRICNMKLNKGDRVYIYFAGHGDAIKGLNEYYLLLSDCQPANDGNNYLLSLGAIDMYHLKNRIGMLTGRGVEVVLILDACRTNELPGGYASQAFNSSIMQTKVGEITMLATGPGQVSIEDVSFGKGHGLFTYNLIDALSGRADIEVIGNKDKIISLLEIRDWVSKEVPRMSEKFKVVQKPVFCCDEKNDTKIGIVDNRFSEAWNQLKSSDPNSNVAVNLSGKTQRSNDLVADTALLALYNHFNNARKENKLWGQNSADQFYELMETRFPRERITEDARYALSADFINFGQQKINLYLEGKDLFSLQIQRDKADSSNSPEFLTAEYERMKNAVSEKWTIAGMMVQKAGVLLSRGDSSVLQELKPKINFFLARGYLNEENENKLSWAEALQKAREAWKADSSAAYTAELLALLYQYRKSFNYIMRAKGHPIQSVEIEFNTQRSEEAVYYFRKVIQLAPNWINSFRTLGTKLFGFENRDSAIYYLKKALTVNPKDAQTYIFLGDLNKWTNPDLANEYYRSVITLTSQKVHADMYNKIARSFLPYETRNWKTQQPDSVLYYAWKGARSDPSNYSSYMNIAEVYNMQNKFDSALKYYKLAVFYKPTYEFGYYFISQIYSNRNMQDSVFYFYDKLMKNFPGSGRAVSAIARYYDQKGNRDSAIAYYKKTLAKNWDKEYSRERLGYIYMGMSKTDTLPHYYFMENLTDGLAGWRDHLNMACYHAYHGEIEKAVQYLETAFQKGLKNKSLVYSDKWLAAIRDTEPFKALMAKY